MIEVWNGVVVALLSTWMIWVVVSRPLTHSRLTHLWSSVSTKGHLGDFQGTRIVCIWTRHQSIPTMVNNSNVPRCPHFLPFFLPSTASRNPPTTNASLAALLICLNLSAPSLCRTHELGTR